MAVNLNTSNPTTNQNSGTTGTKPPAPPTPTTPATGSDVADPTTDLEQQKEAADDVTDVASGSNGSEPEVTDGGTDPLAADGADGSDGPDMSWVYEGSAEGVADSELPTTSAGTGTVASQGSTDTSSGADWREIQMQSTVQDYATAVQNQDAQAANAALDTMQPMVQRPTVDSVEVAQEQAKEADQKAAKQDMRQQLNAEEVYIKQDAQKLKKMEGLAQRQMQIAQKQKNTKAQQEWSDVLERIRSMQAGTLDRKKAVLQANAREINKKWEALKGVKQEIAGGEEAAKPETAEDKEFKKFFKKMVVAGDFLITTKQEKEHAKNVEDREALAEGAEAGDAKVEDKEKTPEEQAADRKKEKAAGKAANKAVRDAKKAQRSQLAAVSQEQVRQAGEKMKAHFAKIGRVFQEGASHVFKKGKADAKGAPATGVEADEGFSITGLFAKISGIFGNSDEAGSDTPQDKATALDDYRVGWVGAFNFATQGRLSAYQTPQNLGAASGATFGKTAASGGKDVPVGQDAVAALGVTTGGGSQQNSNWVSTNEANKAKVSPRHWNVDHWLEDDGSLTVSGMQSTDGLTSDSSMAKV